MFSGHPWMKRETNGLEMVKRLVAEKGPLTAPAVTRGINCSRFSEPEIGTRTRALSLVALLALGFGCGDDDDGGPPAGPSWNEILLVDDSFLSSAWSSGPDDVFVVGGNLDRGEIHHFDGSGWGVETLEDAELLVWVYGLSPTDVYAVGLAGSALHFDGQRWESLAYPGDDDLWGRRGPSRDDLCTRAAVSASSPVRRGIAHR
jgi:hypothetical protein